MNDNNCPFLFIGRLSQEKGVDYLVETFQSNGLDLLIGGDGPLKQDVTEACKRFPRIQYLGSLTKEQVQQQMQCCTALIFPSIWYEGMPITLIEAFAAGLPIIAGNLGVMSSMIRDGYNGLLFEAGNSLDLAARVAEWQSKSPAEKEQFSQNARQTYLDNYTPEKNSIQLLSIYRSVIDKR
ncbi:hypothetical protein FACS189474_1850 [Bacteroidia bacterium]|nr:hypothetical protein FACS189474_1850 [Bacteroidia bacterium]